MEGSLAAGCRQPGAEVEGVGFGETMTTENLFFWPGSRPWCTRTLDRDHDPANLSPVPWCVIWCHRMGIAKPLGRDDLGVHPLRDQKGYNGTGSPRR